MFSSFAFVKQDTDYRLAPAGVSELSLPALQKADLQPYLVRLAQ